MTDGSGSVWIVAQGNLAGARLISTWPGCVCLLRVNGASSETCPLKRRFAASQS